MDREIGEVITQRFSPRAAQKTEAAIEETGGREVFFAGALNPDGLVEDVRVMARGHDTAVNAVFEGLKLREVVIHNHPSGDLTPSDADLALSSAYGFEGHGVYIVDNQASRVYVVVEPFLEEEARPLNTRALQESIASGSKLAESLDHYEERPQQAEMIAVVAKAFNSSRIAVVEAPTGVGKTLSYLLPAVHWAVDNRERVVISTRTINLQEQIIEKDIPMLQRAVHKKFSAVLVKGRGNYLCPSRLQRALSEAELFEDKTEGDALRAIAEWSKRTNDGSLSDLAFVPPDDVWRNVCSDADVCTAQQCTQAGNCFLSKARRNMAKADIIVVNHHLLFSDLAIKREIGNFNALAVLPSYRRVILDEAHNVEDSATAYFGSEITLNGALALLGRLIGIRRGRERGLIPYLSVKVMGAGRSIPAEESKRILSLLDGLQVSVTTAREAVSETFSVLRSYTAEHCGQIGRDIKWRLTDDVLAAPELREIHKVHVLETAKELQNCAEQAVSLERALAPHRENAEHEDVFSIELAQLQGYRKRLEKLAATLAKCTSKTVEEDTVRWIEMDAENDRIVRLIACPLEVGKPLSEWVFGNLKTVVMTSATLAIQRRFDYFFSRTGLSLMDENVIETLALESPFDFEHQALLCIPEDVPSPQERNYLEEISEKIGEVLEATNGRAFLLFTSFYALNFVHSRLEDTLKRAGIRPLKQGADARSVLLDKFRSDTNSVLFATDSFWEGVDVAGEALECVIVPRLPFRVPTEPILQARAEAIEARGGNSFNEFTVPQAVIKFKQGFGRLIRRATDRGVVVVFDSRILTKEYGKRFLGSLPKMRIVNGPTKAVTLAIRRFVNAKEEERDGA